GKIISIYLGNGINILLTGNNNPGFALTFFSQFFCHRLKIQHQSGIISYVLPNLIHKENHMMILLLLFNIGMYTSGKIFNADLILCSSFFTPVPGGLFAHKAHISQYVYHSILNKVKILSGIFPCIPILFFKGMLKFFKTFFFRQT